MTFVGVIVAILAFGFIVFIHELGHFITAKLSGIRVHEFAIGMGPQLFSFKKGETTYAIRAIPMGGFVSMEGEDEETISENSFGAKPIYKRAIVLVSGATMNIILGFILSLILTASNEYVATTTVAEFREDSATSSWMEIDDQIVKIGKNKVRTADDIIYTLMLQNNETMDIEVKRQGENVLLEDVKFNMEYNEEVGREFIRLDFYVYSTQKTFANVMHQSFFGGISVLKSIWASLLGLFNGQVSISDMSGPVGITETIAKSFSFSDLKPFINIMMIITLNVGLFNLLPFPAMDGGRVVFLIIEGITRKKVPAKYEAVINGIGFMILIVFFIFVLFMDVGRIFS